MNRKTKYQVFTAAAVINLIVGITYIWSIISMELQSVYGWSARQASVPYMLALACMPFAMILSGHISDDNHPKWSTLAGSLLWGLGLIICGSTQKFPLICLGYGLIFGTGVGLCTGTTTATAVKWFSAERKGTISGIEAGAIGFSSVYMSFVISALISRFGLSRSLIITGSIGMIIMASASFFMKSPEESAENSVHEDDLTWQEMLKTADFKRLWIIFALGDSGALMIIGSLASIARVQAGIQNAAVLVMAMNLSNSIGRILIGSLSDKTGIRNAFRLSLLLQMGNMLAFRFYTSFPLLLFGACIEGISFGGLISLLTPSSGMFGRSHMALNSAVVNTAYGAGALIMPYVSAWIVDHTGSYSAAYLFASALLAAAFATTFSYTGQRVHKAEKAALQKKTA